MPLCVVCGEKLECTHVQNHSGQSGVEKPCALKKAALWVHVMDDAGEAVEDIEVDVTEAGKKPTVESGFARFDQLDGKKYTAKLPDDLPAAYDAPATRSADVWLAQGEVGYLSFSLPRKPELEVRVEEKGSSGHVFPEAKVQIKGKNAGHEDEATTEGDGIARFGKVPADDYSITVTLKESDARDFFAPPSDFSARTAGKKELAVVEVPARPAPKIDVEAPKLVVVKAKVAARPHRIPVTLSAIGEFDGTGELRSEKLQVFPAVDSDVGERLELPLKGISAETLKGGYTVYVEGKEPSEALGDAKLTLTLAGGAVPPKEAPAEDVITCLRLELQPHRTPGEQLSDEEKKGDGLVVALQTKKKERRRAKVILVVEPREYVGQVLLAAVKDNVTLFDAAKDGAEVSLSAPFDVGPDAKTELWLEGKAVSTGKTDTGLTLKIEDWSETIDAFKATVVDVKLVSYEARGNDGKDDPIAIDDDKKLDPGRTLVLQSPKFAVQRGKLVLLKSPPDAPCKLTVKASAGDDKIKAYPGKAEVERPDPSSSTGGKRKVTAELENHVEGEPGAALPKEVAVDEIKDNAGLTFWVEGAEVSTAREAEVQVDVDKVDDRCDVVSFTVIQPTIEIEVCRSDGKVLADDVDFEVTLMGASSAAKTGTLAKGTTNPKKTIDIDAGHYVVTLAPKDGTEKEMRVNRLVPTGSGAAVPVLAPAQAKFELAPPYKKVQFVGYWVDHLASKGIDALKTTHQERLTESRADMKAKAALMQDAIQKAHAHGEIDPAETTLKVFMAPEFYFRGQQGAYPMEVVSEILAELDGEISKGDYKDWLFVLGTAIGTIGTPEPVTDPAKQATATLGPFLEQKPVGDFSGMASPAINTLAFILTYTSVTRPASGWTMLTPNVCSVTAVGTFPNPPHEDWIVLDWNQTKGWVNGTNATFEEPVEIEIANVAIVRKGGSGTPSGGDARGLKELLIEKEYVAWADLPTPIHEAQGLFFAEGRQHITIYGQIVRAKPPEGSYMPKMFGWSTAPPVNASEINTSGMGGGSVFTIDKITFGLEVCMDHGLGARLQRYYSGTGGVGAPRAKSGEPKLQVQLVPAGGMQIQDPNVCTVNNGLVFNVDVRGVAAKKKGGGAIPTKGVPTLLTKDASAHFDTSGTPGNGQIIVYEAQDVPPPETV